MRAIDSNNVVQILTGENHPQTAVARKVLAQGDLFVCTTAMLEST